MWYGSCERLENVLPYTSILIRSLLQPNDTQTDLRLVSAAFNAIVIPLLYRRVTLSSGLVTRHPDQVAERIIQHVRMNCRVVRIRTRLNWRRAIILMVDCRVLQHLVWSYFPTTSCTIPTIVHDALEKMLPKVSIHIRLPASTAQQSLMSNQNGQLDEADFPSGTSDFFPASGIVSVRDARKIVGSSNQAFFNRLLVSSRSLRTFHASSQFIFRAENGRLPPLKHVSLRGWSYSLDQAKQIWDFSQLTRLGLSNIDVHFFLQSVSPNMFPALRNFTLLNTGDDEPITAGKGLAKFIERLHGLTSVNVNCSGLKYIAEALAKHGKTLTRLVMGFEQHWAGFTINTTDLNRVQESCPHLTFLYFSFDIPSVSPGIKEPLLKPMAMTLSKFTRLRHIVVICTGAASAYAWDERAVRTVKETIQEEASPGRLIHLELQIFEEHATITEAYQNKGCHSYISSMDGEGPGVVYCTLDGDLIRVSDIEETENWWDLDRNSIKWWLEMIAE